MRNLQGGFRRESDGIGEDRRPTRDGGMVTQSEESAGEAGVDIDPTRTDRGAKTAKLQSGPRLRSRTNMVGTREAARDS